MFNEGCQSNYNHFQSQHYFVFVLFNDTAPLSTTHTNGSVASGHFDSTQTKNLLDHPISNIKVKHNNTTKIIKKKRKEDMADRVRPNANLPPGSTDLLLRRISAVALAIYLYTVASPFAPISWATQPDYITYLDGPRLIDRIISPIVVMGAAILHWYIASQRDPLPIVLSLPNGQAQQNVRDGRVEMGTSDLVLGLWVPSYYWTYVAAEAAILWGIVSSGAGMTGLLMSRVAVVGVLGASWVLGWSCMPWYRKEQAWALIKDYVVRLIIMEMIDSAFGGGSNRRRRRRM